VAIGLVIVFSLIVRISMDSGFTAYGIPGQDDATITKLHHPRWYVLRIVSHDAPKHVLVEHVGTPYATMPACQAGLKAVAAANWAHTYICGAYLWRFY